MSRCRSCGASITWAKTVNGKNMPLDELPDPDGTWLVDQDGVCHYLKGVEAAEAAASGESLHVCHWSTCPDADRHRRR
jgi:hypothetical protein